MLAKWPPTIVDRSFDGIPLYQARDPYSTARTRHDGSDYRASTVER